MDVAGSKIEKLQELLSRESSGSVFSQGDVMSGIYAHVLTTAYHNYPAIVDAGSLLDTAFEKPKSSF